MTNAGVNGYPSVPSLGSRQLVVIGLATPKSTVGTWAYNQNTSAYFSGYIQNSGTSAQNDSIAFYEVWLDAGTWQLDLIGFASTDGAQVSASLVGPGTIAFSGTQEQYAASGASFRSLFAGVTVPTAGLYSAKFSAPSHNASSSSYRMRISAAVLTRTA